MRYIWLGTVINYLLIVVILKYFFHVGQQLHVKTRFVAPPIS